MLSVVYTPLVIALLSVFFFFSNSFCSIPSRVVLPWFFLCHASFRHLFKNLLALAASYILAEEVKVKDRDLVAAFLVANALVAFFAVSFKVKVVGASAGIYAMIGLTVPEMARVTDPFLILAAIAAAIIFERPAVASPWVKLFHLLGFLAGFSLGAAKMARKVFRYEDLAKAYLRYF